MKRYLNWKNSTSMIIKIHSQGRKWPPYKGWFWVNFQLSFDHTLWDYVRIQFRFVIPLVYGRLYKREYKWFRNSNYNEVNSNVFLKPLSDCATLVDFKSPTFYKLSPSITSDHYTISTLVDDNTTIIYIRIIRLPLSGI